MIVIVFSADQLSSQFDNMRQVQVVRFDLSVMLRDALEASVESATDLNHYRIRMAH